MTPIPSSSHHWGRLAFNSLPEFPTQRGFLFAHIGSSGPQTSPLDILPCWSGFWSHMGMLQLTPCCVLLCQYLPALRNPLGGQSGNWVPRATNKIWNSVDWESGKGFNQGCGVGSSAEQEVATMCWKLPPVEWAFQATVDSALRDFQCPDYPLPGLGILGSGLCQFCFVCFFKDRSALL